MGHGSDEQIFGASLDVSKATKRRSALPVTVERKGPDSLRTRGFDVEDCVRVAELNLASTGARVPGARLDRLDLQVCICRSKDIRSQCIA